MIHVRGGGDYVADNNELSHYGVKGMKWGIRKSYNRWRSQRNKKLSDRWDSKAESMKFKSYLNPVYTIRKGVAGGHARRAEKHQETLEFLDWMTKHDREISAISDTLVGIGKDFIPKIMTNAAK